MRRSSILPLVTTCIILGITEAFLIPSQPSQRVHFQSSNRVLQAKLGSTNDSRNGRGFLFKIPRRKEVQFKNDSPRESRSRKIRRYAGILLSAIFIWFGAAGLRTNPSYASTEVAPIVRSTSMFSASLDKIVDGYVKEHMFDDDVYDPVESVYREAIMDQDKGSHPKALKEIASSVLGKEGVKIEKQKSANGIGGLLLDGIKFLQRRVGLSETAAILVLTGSFVIIGPAGFLFISMMVGAQSKRQINSVMKKRYGDTYTVDASIKVEEDVELPDEDDDDEDDDDASDEDDDDEDE